jgi:site-specific DNA-methyltransferase (adenine-specific)
MKNQVILGDCLEVMKDIPDKSIDMILCDLPYGTTACKWDTIIPFEPLWEQYKRIIKDNGAIVLTASQPFTSALVMSNVKMYRHQWIWNKRQSGNPFLAKLAPLKIFEEVIVFSKNKVNYYPQMRIGKMRIKGGVKVANQITGTKPNNYNVKNDTYHPEAIIEFSTAGMRGIYEHPTQKPVALFEYLIKTYTNEGDLVLDNAAGSGTTGIAARNLNRNFILIEKEQEYIDIINERLSTPISLD